MSKNGESFWQKLWRTPRSRWLLGIPLGGFLALFVGAAGLGAANYAMHVTSSNEFCFSCHSHEVNLREAYEASSHFSNASGVRADCADCHIPHDNWFDLVKTKIVVSADIIPEMQGKLDTPEKWNKHLPHMAEVVWEQFRENDSRFCRSCHTVESMNLELQSRMAGRSHGRMAERGRTCIDCHEGLVHELPEEG